MFVGSKVVGVKAAAVSVNCETTVPAADVRTAATSGVGSDGVGAPATSNKQKGNEESSNGQF